ncbi:hypothetical protein F5Y08DRAFT_173119 [Xylaria arbuscula]|nr:hypothetical protein F5Y08DRAFT_173119 [Xylaria arbuscula]
MRTTGFTTGHHLSCAGFSAISWPRTVCDGASSPIAPRLVDRDTFTTQFDRLIEVGKRSCRDFLSLTQVFVRCGCIRMLFILRAVRYPHPSLGNAAALGSWDILTGRPDRMGHQKRDVIRRHQCPKPFESKLKRNRGRSPLILVSLCVHVYQEKYSSAD